jgi:protease I
MRLLDKKIAFLIDEGFEDLEFWVTVMRLREEGARVTIVSPEKKLDFHGKNGLAGKADVCIDQVRPEQFDAVVVPGGWAPDKMRRSEAVKALVRETHAAGRIVGLICHAGLVAISAGVVKGSRATGSLGIKDDLENAGAIWVDEPAFRDGCLVWGRVVADIPDFCRELVAAIEKP